MQPYWNADCGAENGAFSGFFPRDGVKLRHASIFEAVLRSRGNRVASENRRPSVLERCFASSPAAIWLVLLLTVLPHVDAEDLTQRYAPKAPPTAGVVKPAELPAPADPGNDTRSLIPKLKAIVFESGTQTIPGNSGAVSGNTSPGIHRDGVEVPKPQMFDKLAGGHLGKPLSMASLNGLVRELILFWRAQDHPIVDIVVPEQDITSGVLRLVIVEGRVGKVRVEGARWFAPRKLVKKVRLKPGDRIRASVLKADLDWLNNNSFRRVNLIYTPGSERGSTDLVLKTEDRLPFRLYVGYEDTGIETTANKQWQRNRWQTGFNWGNAFGADQLLSYQFTTSDDLKNVRAHALSYSIPLPWRHILAVSASYSETETDTGSTLLHGTGWGGGLRYTIPLPGSARFAETFSFCADWSRSDSNIDLGGESVYSKPVEIRRLGMEYQASLQDRWGATAASAIFYYSPGDWGTANSDSRFSLARASADSSYAIGRFTLERLFKLPANWSFSTRANGQVANGPLTPTEAFYLGGWDSVRGYEQGDTHGDEGCTVTLELRTVPFGAIRWLGWKSAPDQLQFLAFLDYGAVRTLEPLAGDAETSERAGAGIGVRYVIDRWLSLRCDYAWQLLDPGSPATVSSTYTGRLHMGLTISY